MMEQYRDFWICGNAEAVHESLLGRISGWCPKGSVDYERPAHSLVELTRFQLRTLTFDEKQTAEIFGLEIARLLLDTGYREFASSRTQTENDLMRRDRLRR